MALQDFPTADDDLREDGSLFMGLIWWVET